MEKNIISINPTIFLKQNEENPEKVELVDNLIMTHLIKMKALLPFLNSLFESLKIYSNDQKKGIPRYAVNDYLSLPGLIGERIFNLFDKKRTGYVSQTEMVSGLARLFPESLEEAIKLIFDLFDFDSDGQISQEDIRTLISHVPIVHILGVSEMAKMREGYYSKKASGFPLFLDRLQSQEELVKLLNDFMKDKICLTLKDFVNSTENRSCTLFLCLFLLIRRSCPIFQDFTLFCIKNTIKVKEEEFRNTPKSRSKMLASPRFESDTTKFSPLLEVVKNSPSTPGKKPCSVLRQLKERKGEALKKLSPFAPTFPSPVMSAQCPVEEEKNDSLPKIEIAKLSKPMEKSNPYFDSISTNDLSPISNTECVRQPSHHSGETHSSTMMVCACGNECHSSEEECKAYRENMANLKFSGYLYEKIRDNTLNRSWYKLIGNILYRYESKMDIEHNGIFALVGSLVQELMPFTSHIIALFPFKINFGRNEIQLYCLNMDERNEWISRIKEAIGYSNLTEYYELMEPLGRGKFGQVRAAIHKKSKKRVAIKIIKKARLNLQDLDLAKREIAILKMCQHPNIIRLYDIFENTDSIFIVMELLEGKSLYEYLSKRDFKLSEARICNIIHYLATALYYIHSYGIVHRDIKLDNILLTNDSDESEPKLVDFGLSKMIGPNELCNDPFGTLGFASPEVLLGKPYDKSVDLWGLGVVLYIMLIGKAPFAEEEDDSEEKIGLLTLSKNLDFTDIAWRKISEEAKDCTRRMLEKDPKDRMTVKELLTHPWIKQHCAEVIALRRAASTESAFRYYSLIKPLSVEIYEEKKIAKELQVFAFT